MIRSGSVQLPTSYNNNLKKLEAMLKMTSEKGIDDKAKAATT